MRYAFRLIAALFRDAEATARCTYDPKAQLTAFGRKAWLFVGVLFLSTSETVPRRSSSEARKVIWAQGACVSDLDLRRALHRGARCCVEPAVKLGTADIALKLPRGPRRVRQAWAPLRRSGRTSQPAQGNLDARPTRVQSSSRDHLAP